MMTRHCSILITLYRAVLFDMDGVVTDTMPLHLRAWQEAFGSIGVRVEKADVYRREGRQSKAMAQEIAAAKGIRLSDDELGKIVELKGRIFDGEAIKAKAFGGAPELLRMLRDNGLKTALVTGSRSQSAQVVLHAAGLEGLFDVIVSGDDTEKGKPAPAPYLKAIEKAGVNRLDCVVVENAPLGVQAAKAAGVGYVIAVATSLGPEHLWEADDVMESVAGLEQCIARSFAARPSR